MRTDDGTFIGVRVDITEFKRREKALRDSMRQIDLFRHVLDELPVAAFIKSNDLRIEYVNKAWSLDYRHLQGGGGRAYRSSSCSACPRPMATPMPTPRSASPARSSRRRSRSPIATAPSGS